MKTKLIVAALALAAAGSANAAIQNGASGNGELFAVVASKTAGYSFVADLGQTMNAATGFTQFNTAANLNVALSSYAEWTSFSSAVAGASDLQFGVLALDATGTGLNGRNMLTTTASSLAATAIKNTTNGNFSTAVTNYDALLGATGLIDPTQNMGTDMTNSVSNNGSAYQSAANTTTYFYGQGISSDFEAAFGKLTFSVLANVGDHANFGKVSVSGSVSSSKVNYAAFTNTSGNDYWTLNASTGALNYVAVPVPEADSLALILAGMGLVGFLARRRNAA